MRTVSERRGASQLDATATMKKGGGGCAIRTQKLENGWVRETQSPDGSVPCKDAGRQLGVLSSLRDELRALSPFPKVMQLVRHEWVPLSPETLPLIIRNNCLSGLSFH